LISFRWIHGFKIYKVIIFGKLQVITWDFKCSGIFVISIYMAFKGILSTKIVIFWYPKLLSFSVLTFIKWRLTPSYAAKDTIILKKRPKIIVIRIIVLDDNIQIYSYGLLCDHVLSMRTA
jgi:hypothetical protein